MVCGQFDHGLIPRSTLPTTLEAGRFRFLRETEKPVETPEFGGKDRFSPVGRARPKIGNSPSLREKELELGL